MINYKLNLFGDTPIWWRNFLDYKIKDGIGVYIELADRDGNINQGFIDYINHVLKQRYDAYYVTRFGKHDLLEFSTDEGRMLFMLEWA
jgi:hypothetical protein